jgi:hypothetical protein
MPETKEAIEKDAAYAPPKAEEDMDTSLAKMEMII